MPFLKTGHTILRSIYISLTAITLPLKLLFTQEDLRYYLEVQDLLTNAFKKVLYA